MLDNKVKIPMMIGVILYGLAVLIDIGCTLMQKTIILSNVSEAPDKTFFTTGSAMHIFMFVLLFLSFVVMLKYRGSSRRGLGALLLILYCVVGLMTYVFSFFKGPLIYYNYTATEVAAVTTLETYISIFTTPFTLIAAVLCVLAMGRYGVCDNVNGGM